MLLSTRELLAQYAILLNTHGAVSPQADRFLLEHCGNREFVRLAQTSRWLKEYLAAPATGAEDSARPQ
jgi:hypothetical protein